MPARQTVAGAIGFVLVLGMGFRAAGWIAAIGASIGATVAAISIASLAVIVNLLSQTRPAPRQGTATVMLTNILKLPILVAGLYFGTRLPTVGIYCFLAAIGLVYFCSVWFLAERLLGPEPHEKNP